MQKSCVRAIEGVHAMDGYIQGIEAVIPEDVQKQTESSSARTSDPRLSFLIEEYKIAFQTYLMTQTKDENVSRFFFSTCLIFGAGLLIRMTFPDGDHVVYVKAAVTTVIILLFIIGLTVMYILGKLYLSRIRAAKRMNYIRRYFLISLPGYEYERYAKLAGFRDVEELSDLTILWANKGQFVLIVAFLIALLFGMQYVVFY